MLNSVEHEISNAHKYKNIKKFSFFQDQISYFFGYKMGIFSCQNDPNNLHPSYKQGCRQHVYFLPSAADHGLHGASLLPLANYVYMCSVILEDDSYQYMR